MTIGERLLDCRKKSHLSQEMVAERLNVTRQTISKWETDQSTPDFEKLVPICKLFQITADELLLGTKHVETLESPMKKKRKKAFAISISVFLYFLSLIWVVICGELFFLGEAIVVPGFLFLCAIATIILVYFSYMQDEKPKEIPEVLDEKKSGKIEQYIIGIVTTVFVILYLVLSFLSMAWHITWILWIVYVLVVEIIHLMFFVGGQNEK